MPVIQPREPPAADEGLLILPQLENSYRYVLFHFGPLQVTRKGANLALNSTCLTFTVLQAAHLALCTTTPEAMAAGLRWYLRPLRVFSAPIDEIVFTVLLSLRFTSIVFEEIRNISLGLAARGVQWHLLGWRGTVSALSSLLSRTLESLFITSAALADAITARGYVSAEQHRLFSPANDARGRLLGRTSDVAALFALAMFAVHLSDHV
jgi:general transcription factor 3C polypeptide 2